MALTVGFTVVPSLIDIVLQNLPLQLSPSEVTAYRYRMALALLNGTTGLL